ncbi:MAG: ankyrin repeat domain-containing protein [Roseibacillus sp. TMED18]|nr:MAG: ankyrin repeat domain-containing protein [Roseibacillus sp. TMED18]
MKHHWLTLLCSIALILPASADPMREAISSGDAEAVQQLLVNGADPHFVEAVPGHIAGGLSPQGRYPTIGLCMYHNQPHLIPLFIDAGADPHGLGCAPLFVCLVYTHLAAASGQTETLRHLIAAGVSVDNIVAYYPLATSLVPTPLGVALASGQLQTARFLLDNGANPSSQIFAARTAEAIDLLIEYGATINGVRIPKGFRSRFNRQFLELPLAYGAVLDETSLLDLLTTQFNVLDPNGPESRVDPDELEWLLNNGIRVGGTLEDLTTILHFAIQRRMSLPVVEVLVEAGADLNAVNVEGETPLMLARDRNRSDVADYLVENGGTESDLPGYEQAIVDDNVAALASYLDQGMSPDYRPQDCSQGPREGGPPPPWVTNPDIAPPPPPPPPLLIALQNNAVECARLLVRHGASVNLRYCNTSPLQVMLEENNLSGVQFLLDHGASLSQQLNTPLHLAAQHDSLDVAGHLASADSMAALNAFGATPLDVATGETLNLLQQRQAPAGHGVSFWDAIRTGNLELVKAYQEEGLDLQTVEPASEGNPGNLTPLLQAMESRQAEMALYLIGHHENVFAESNLLEAARESQLSDLVEYLQTLFRLDLVPVHYWKGYFQLHVNYAGFDDSGRYHLESSSDLENWSGIEATSHSFQDSTQQVFTIQLPDASRQFFRLQRLEE